MSREEIEKLVVTLEEEMFQAAEELRFEYAAKLRDELKELRRDLVAFAPAGPCRREHEHDHRRLVSGFLTGGLARFAVPGPDPMPIWLTLAIGLTGSVIGAAIGSAISNDNGYVISFLSYGIAISLVIAYRRFVQHRPAFGPGAYAYPEKRPRGRSTSASA